MDKELENLLDNYENAIYGQAFPIAPSIHQLHLLLDYIANLEQQGKKQKEVINKAIDKLYCWGEALDPEFQKIMLDILKEVK